MSQLDETIRNRRSVRVYTGEPVPRETVDAIIEAGCWAPTACNKQEFAFIYIDDPEALLRLQKCGAAAFVSKARQAVLVLYGNQTDNVEYRDDKLSAGAVLQNMLLKAHESGVGACLVCNLPSKAAVRRLFCVPRGLDPIALVTFGRPAYEPKDVARRLPAEQVVSHNTFSTGTEPWRRKPFTHTLRKFARRIYIRLPKTKTMLRLLERVEKKFDN